MAVGTGVWKERDGKAVDVTLQYATEGMAVAYVQGWLGITNRSGNSGENVALSIARTEYQFEVPAALAVSKGEIVRIDLAQLGTNHTPPDAAYNKNAASATNIDLFKATAAKDANNVVTGILLAGL
jgi:hypothetical protein